MGIASPACRRGRDNAFQHSAGSASTVAGPVLSPVGVHHGHLRPSIVESGLTPGIESDKQNPLRLEAAERFVRLQRLLGRWRLAYLEALLKTADAEASRFLPEEDDYEA